ncbi:hypothetical protein ACLF6K_38360 (plasmid) [Streptomyces xanthophaeus]|uniref:hypothetical protein n=1 Tax=Streptomyces xanthophaeus TaxID=67385 RepID=UPI00398FCAFB
MTSVSTLSTGHTSPLTCDFKLAEALWNERVLPDGLTPVSFSTVLRGSLLPIAVWLGIAVFVYFIYNPVVAAVEGGLFLAFFLLGVTLRRRSGHTTKCSLHGATGGVLDKSMAGF